MQNLDEKATLEKAASTLEALAGFFLVAWMLVTLAKFFDIHDNSLIQSYLLFGGVACLLLSLLTRPDDEEDRKAFVILRAALVFDKPGASPVPVRALAPGTAVYVVGTQDDWSLVEKDGEQLGHVATVNLAPIS